MAQIALDTIIISTKLAEKRIGKFAEKKAVIEAHYQELNLLPSINYKPEHFSTLLKTISCGLRIYFAVKDEKNLQLDVVFALTDNKANDTGTYFIIDQATGLQPVKKTDASQFVTTYVTKMCPYLRTGNPYETESIYYSVEKPKELIGFFENKGVTEFTIHFAAYINVDDVDATDDDKNYNNQLGLIFQIKSNQLRDEKIYVSLSVEREADTGVPCAPPRKCDGLISLPIK